MNAGIVTAVCKSPGHTLHKTPQEAIVLIKGLGVKGDAHMGETVKHRSRVAKDPSQPNLRQVHLIHSELHQELKAQGFRVKSGEMGENITTTGINLLGLPRDTVLKIGEEAQVRITGLRNPCHQLETIQEGLMKAVLDRDEEGNLIRKAGVMGVVLKGGRVKIGDVIKVELPSEQPFKQLEKV
jgi:MOSC domain-containing protein YiiM